MALDPTALFTISYGLYVLTTRDDRRDCGCIVNSVMQLTEKPLRIAVSVNRQTHTAHAVEQHGLFNLSVISEQGTMALFRRFGFQSGRDTDIFAESDDPSSENGLRYLNHSCCALISGKVERVIDCGTHVLFIAAVTEAKKLSAQPPMTYDHYFAHVKPQSASKPKRGYVCRICGYFHEGDVLPEDFVCPICKHGATDFEPVGF